MPLHYKQGSLFDAPEDHYLAHAVNEQGVWGSGIAKEFKNRFPWAYSQYQGDCILITKLKYGMFGRVLWFKTSGGYGKNKDTEEVILRRTSLAINQFLFYYPDATVSIPKINSGLFKVPWEKTERVINNILELYPDSNWYVWTP